MKRYQALEMEFLIMNDDVITSSADDILVSDGSFGSDSTPFADLFS